MSEDKKEDKKVEAAKDKMAGAPEARPKILLVDDEDQFRRSMAKQLTVRGYEVLDANNGKDAIKLVRHENPEVVVLDQNMPEMDGLQALQEIKNMRPEVQVIMLTGYGSTKSARVSGKYDAFRYLMKPCSPQTLIDSIEAARQERVYAMARQEIPEETRGGLWQWLMGTYNRRPGFIILGAILFALIVLMPAPSGMLSLLSAEKTGKPDEAVAGYSDYKKMHEGDTITEYYCNKASLCKEKKDRDGNKVLTKFTPGQTAFRAKAMMGTLVVAALFWGSAAIPVGMTVLLVGALMYIFGVLPPDLVAKAFAKDSVIFIFGVLSFSAAVAKTGLDKRIGILLLSACSSLPRFLFIFLPLLSCTASFLSEHALVAFIIPVLILGYTGVLKASDLKQDRALMVVIILSVCFAANIGGPGSPAAGGRNAVMLGILADYGVQIGFGEWVMYGLPFVPVMALVIAAYFFVAFRGRVKVKRLNLIKEIRKETEKLGRMTRHEHYTAGVLVLLILMWVTLSNVIGMGGPVLIALVLLNLLGVLRWRDINSIHWDVVALYAGASAMGYGLALTGGALWVADGFTSILPEYFKSGEGLAISSSLFTGVLTNFMSDGATVAAIGPVTVPMATLSGTSEIMIGLATAFASSFAHMMIIGTPNNAIAYSLARDPETGEQLVTMKDFFVHGFFVLILCFAVLFGWVFYGYWQWMGF
ncbi:MAG: SLC13 family permease [bacterium]